MTDSTPSARERAEAERQTGRSGGGESGGGGAPDPRAGKDGSGNGGFMGHGGQSEMAYHGTGRLGEKEVGGNANAPAGEAGSDGKAESEN